MALEPGAVFDGKYRIVRRVGKGGMGSVYEAENMRIKSRVAIKILHADVGTTAEFIQRFEREAQAAGRIGSEHIVEVYDLGTTPDKERFMVLEFLDGEDLRRRIKRRGRLGGVEAAHILNQVLIGLGAAHDAQIVHRDMKPDNVFLLKNRAGLRDFVKILDFGVSKFTGLDQNMDITKVGAIMGTPYYMSPEQARGDQVDHRSDLYAVGVMLYQMLCGRRPFEGKSFNELLFTIALDPAPPITQFAPDCPLDLVAIVERAISRDPNARYQTAYDFRAAIEAWEEGNVGEEAQRLSYSGPYSGRGRLSRSGATPLGDSYGDIQSDIQSGGSFNSSLGPSGRISLSEISVTGPASSRRSPISLSDVPISSRTDERLGPLSGRPSTASQTALSVSQEALMHPPRRRMPLIVVGCTLAGAALAGGISLLVSADHPAAGRNAGAAPTASIIAPAAAPPEPEPVPSASAVVADASASAPAPSAEPTSSARAAQPPPSRPPPDGARRSAPGSTVVDGRRLKTGL